MIAPLSSPMHPELEAPSKLHLAVISDDGGYSPETIISQGVVRKREALQVYCVEYFGANLK